MQPSPAKRSSASEGGAILLASTSASCIAHAVSKLEGMALLFKGEDFRKTDVKPALRS